MPKHDRLRDDAFVTTVNHSRTQVYFRLTLIAALLSMLGPFSVDTYLPSFPAIEFEFSVSRAVLSQSLGAYLFAFALSTLFWGPLADAWGRKRVMWVSLLVYSLASIGCALAQNMDVFLGLRVLQGLAASGGMIAGRAMIRDAHDETAAHQAMAQVTMMFALAPAVAPILGGWLHELWGWRSIFWFLLCFSLLLVWMVKGIRETLPKEHRHAFQAMRVMHLYAGMLQHRQFMAWVLSMSFAFAGIFLYIAGAPTVVYDFLGLDSRQFQWLFLPMVSGMMLGSWLSSYLAGRWQVAHILKLSFALMTTGWLLNIAQAYWLEASLLSVVAPMLLYAIALSIGMPAFTILTLDCFPKNRGACASMQGFMQMMVSALVASVFVPLLHGTLLEFVLGQGVFLGLATCLWWKYDVPLKHSL